MTREFLETLTRRYHAYVDRFRDGAGHLPHLHQLKAEHTACVVADARRIMAGEGWPEEVRPAGEACALLHDVGRHPQLKEYGTFRDAASIDHATRGVEVIGDERFLEELDADMRKRVLTAVALHNKKEVPAALEAETARLTHLVRDADKLDIFRVLETVIADGSLDRNPEIAWGLQVLGAPSPEVVAAVSVGHSVDYGHVRTLSDFVLIQVGWLIGGFRNPTALRLAAERKALEFRETFLRTLSDDPGVDVCCEAARAYLERRAGAV